MNKNILQLLAGGMLAIFASDAPALSGKDKLSDFASASQIEQWNLCRGAAKIVDHPKVDHVAMCACVDEVASDRSLGTMNLSTVLAGCAVLLKGE